MTETEALKALLRNAYWAGGFGPDHHWISAPSELAFVTWQQGYPDADLDVLFRVAGDALGFQVCAEHDLSFDFPTLQCPECAKVASR